MSDADHGSSEAQRLRQRAKLMLRAERAMGVLGVIRAQASVDSPSTNDVLEPSADERGSSPSILASSDVPIDPKAALRDAILASNAATSASKAQPAHSKTSTGQALFAGAGGDTAHAFGPDRPAFESPVHPRARKLELLDAMNEQEVKVCRKCVLCETRTNTVFGEGDADAQLMFIGEGPGENEDLQGRPFIGRAGELLGKQIAAMGLSREQVFIANIVKCRPPNNRVPAPEEVAACTPYLERQIEIIRPRVIVTLGLPSTQYMLQSKLAMSKLRGQWHAWRGIRLMPTYHPAYLLRNYTDATRAAVWSDLKQVMSELGLKTRG